jgi:hypothetical protein
VPKEIAARLTLRAKNYLARNSGWISLDAPDTDAIGFPRPGSDRMTSELNPQTPALEPARWNRNGFIAIDT